MASDHIHRYKKIDIGGETKEFFVYKCMKPTCSHYLPINLAEGQMCECNRCHEPMIITKKILTHSAGKPMTKPHCGACVKRKKSADVDAIAEFLKGTQV